MRSLPGWRSLVQSRLALFCLTLSVAGLLAWFQFGGSRQTREAGQPGTLHRTDSAALALPVLPAPAAAARTAGSLPGDTPGATSVGLLQGMGILVRVVSQRTGAGQAGAELLAQITDREGLRHQLEARSDAAGELRLPFDPAEILDISLSARAEGAGSARARWDLEGRRFDGSEALELRLIATRAIGGRVLDAAGFPVEGAQVQLRLTELYNNQKYRRIKSFLATRSDVQGRWSLPDAPEIPSRYLLSLFHPDFVPLLSGELAGSLSTKALWEGSQVNQLQAGHSITLCITDPGGAALEGSHARLIEPKDPAFFGIPMLADEGGRFHFTVSPENEFFVTAGAPGFGQDVRRFGPTQAGQALEWKMQPRTRRQIRLVEPSGLGLAGARVRPFIQTWDECLTSDPQGLVTLEVRGGSWVLIQIQRPDALGLVNRLVRPGAETISMPAPLDLELLVLDAQNGEPLGDCLVTVLHPGQRRRGRHSDPGSQRPASRPDRW